MGSIIYLIFGFIVFLVVFRFIFRLLGANPSNAFVSFVYGLSAPLVAPFASIFGQSTVVDEAIAGGTFEWASLIAIIVYAIIASIASRAFGPTHYRV